MRRPTFRAILRGVTPGSTRAGPRLLIVDDNTQFLEAARSLLERGGAIVVDVATTSAEALQLAQRHHPDAILVDVFLGEESGFDLVRQLATHNAHIPVVLVSTHAETDFSDLITASPAIGFLSKTDLSTTALSELLEQA